jgi:SAM-dependent methyltransferase
LIPFSKGFWCDEIPFTLRDDFDIASCQFAIHYMFESKSKADHFFEQIGNHLRPNGRFIATTIDCRVLANYVTETYVDREYATVFSHNAYGDSHTNEGIEIVFKNEFGDKTLCVTFPNAGWRRLLGIAGKGSDVMLVDNEVIGWKHIIIIFS